MARKNRLKLSNEEVWYHLTSRTVGKEFLINNVEKEKLQKLIFLYSAIYYVRILGFAIMSNHFHLLVKFNPSSHYKREDIMERIKLYKREGDVQVTEKEYQHYKNKFGDLSDYMKDIKQNFARWYNKLNNRWGYFWGDRYNSVIFQSGKALLDCLTYIDLNPVRAGIVANPEEYRWSSAGYRFAGGNIDGILSFDGIFSDDMEEKEMEIEYLNYLKGNLHEKFILGTNGKSVKINNRINYFTKGVVVGSELFIRELLAKYKVPGFYNGKIKYYRVFKGIDLYTINKFIT